MLYSYSLLKSSYSKNEEVAEKLHNVNNLIKIDLNEEENCKYDGHIRFCGVTGYQDYILEMKQRQDYFIKNIYEGKPEYSDYQIISTAYQKSNQEEQIVYLIYDLSLRYLLIFDSSNICFDKKVENWNKIQKWKCKGLAIIWDLETGEYKQIMDLGNLKQ